MGRFGGVIVRLWKWYGDPFKGLGVLLREKHVVLFVLLF